MTHKNEAGPEELVDLIVIGGSTLAGLRTHQEALVAIARRRGNGDAAMDPLETVLDIATVVGGVALVDRNHRGDNPFFTK